MKEEGDTNLMQFRKQKLTNARTSAKNG